MKFCVVIPLYNKAPYIKRAINSVLNQTIQDFEIIVVNDGSTDNGQEVVEGIQDPRIRLINQPNQGVSVARNRGIEEAHYPFIAFLDADDEWKPEFLAHIQRLYNNFSDCGAYATSYEIIDPKNKVSYPDLNNIPPEPWIGIIPNLFQLMQHNSPFCTSSIAIPRDVLLLLNGFPEGIQQGEDRILWTRLGIKYPVAFSPSPQAIYHREATNRACHTFQPEPETANYIDKMLINNEVPVALIHDIRDYRAYLVIQKAHLMVIEDHADLARPLLRSIGKNKKYSVQILKWYLLSLMPYKVIKVLRK